MLKLKHYFGEITSNNDQKLWNRVIYQTYEPFRRCRNLKFELGKNENFNEICCAWHFQVVA